MDSPVPISVLIGKAVLSNDGLHVDGEEVNIWHSGQFLALIFTTQVLISEALRSSFSADFGSLEPSGGVLKLVPGGTPWEQYIAATLEAKNNHDACRIIAGWCLMLALLAESGGVSEAHNQAYLVARYIADDASRAMFVDQVELERWLAWRQSCDPFAGELAQLAHEDRRPPNPYHTSASVLVPWVAEFGQFLPINFAKQGSDITVTEEHACVSAGSIHFVHGKSALSQIITRKSDESHYIQEVDDDGVLLRFRSSTRGGTTILRLLPRPFNLNFDAGALQ
ncbi:hypothetical protein [Pseudomonas putida]|uniref:Uncharacterized protein n=1 Tax=Pseudomonas putida TaxID=303 RepID=A0A8I1JKV0_PSEPU|nr:hypothetical protein [Pseudomonas putida]MBI6885114.1 hypothetical protein [Pseudomonas putida]